ncbi:MAG: ABC transporter permease [Candidatus Acidiferrales bacterium]
MFWRDLHLAWRSSLRNPGYSFLIVAVLAIGIGTNTAIFGLANAAFFRALPYPHAERLAFLWQNNQRTGESEGAVSYPNYADWRAQSRTFQDMAFIMTGEILLSQGGDLQRVAGGLVSTNFFSVLGVQPLLGRDFATDDALPDRPHVIILGYGL